MRSRSRIPMRSTRRAAPRLRPGTRIQGSCGRSSRRSTGRLPAPRRAASPRERPAEDRVAARRPERRGRASLPSLPPCIRCRNPPTGAGQHGVATATVCALLDMECVVYMGVEDTRRQRPNVQRMELLGATVQPVDAGARTLKEATSAAIRDWVTNVQSTHYVIGSVVGPAPYPALVRDLQRVIGDEARAQILEREDKLPARVVACVGGGSNALGVFAAFIADEQVELVGVEAGGEGIETPRHGAPLTVAGRPGILHGSRSAVMQDEEGQILEAHSVSAGLDYPGAGPQHAFLRDTGRARYEAVSDEQALRAFGEVARLEGILPALETAHALAWVLAQPRGELDLICLSGRGDKDLAEVLARA